MQASDLCFFVMFNKFFRGHAMQVAKFGLHHDGELTQELIDDAFRNAVDRPADIRLL